MAFRRKTIGVNFPFQDSENGDYLQLTGTPEAEIRSDLIHLLLTKKGSRYMLPEFGTNLYQYLFEPLDSVTTSKIENDIHDAVEKYIPSLKVNKIIILKFGDDGFDSSNDASPHKIKIKLEYEITQRTFEFKDSVVISF